MWFVLGIQPFHVIYLEPVLILGVSAGTDMEYSGLQDVMQSQLEFSGLD